MPLTAEQRARISLSDPWDFGWLAEMVEAWGFRMMQERGHFADRYEVAKRWFEQEYAPVSDMLAEGGLTEPEETEAEAYMRLAGQRYLMLRTHEWSDEIVNRLRRGNDKKRRRLPRRRRRAAFLTRRPLGSRVGMRTVFSFALGAAAGAAAARLLTPSNGRKAASAASTAASAASTQAHHSANAMKGVAHAVTPHRHESMDDMTLADRVRSEIFRDHEAPKGGVVGRRPGGRRLPARRGAGRGVGRALRQGRAQGHRHRRRQEPAAHARHAEPRAA